MRGARVNFFRAVVHKSLCAVTDRAGGVDHVIEHKATFALDVSDNVCDFRHVGFGAPLIDATLISLFAADIELQADQVARLFDQNAAVQGAFFMQDSVRGRVAGQRQQQPGAEHSHTR